jgi:hypothetical protein
MKVTGIPIRYREDKAYIEDAIRENYSVISYLEQIEPSTFAQSIKSKEESNYVTERLRTV